MAGIMERYEEIIPDFERFKEVAKTHQPREVRVNTLKSSVSEVKRMFDREGVEYEQRDWNPRFFRIDSSPGKLFSHWLGKIYGQESVSGIPSLALEPKPGEKVLDLCAAPGSKTTQIAALMGNQGEIFANDKSSNRLRSLVANVYRTGALNVQTFQRDARNLPEDWKFDKVLVDAPCSAEGNLREKEELRQGADISQVESLSELQKALLGKGFRLLKEGGTLVYSTCTFAPEENEEVVAEFLGGAELVDLSFDFSHSNGLTSWKGEAFPSKLENAVRVYPHQLDSGGIFVAKFEG
ncbi:MAG: RsmB/NOP family class I SAM-dependent RNA methyltransferase [Candidatus Nanohaloarchaeota archaeon QJJ-9]|nr:RsmB/NOP family class I SAM-dependent RNA methyltransferase [Candidatus Nanohaloarchaeota archaeon QJJ-9]